MFLSGSAPSQCPARTLRDVSAPSIFAHHRSLRWSVPACVAGVVALAAGGVFTAQASSKSLPPITAAALLADVQSAQVPGFSGTIVAQMSLGLPALPALSGGPNGVSMASLLSGSHTMRFWYGGPERQRVALLGTTNETDVFHNGRDVWQWDSDGHVATHTVLPKQHRPSVAQVALTPRQLADRALAAIEPTTAVSVATERRVADRAAYELVLTPRGGTTRVDNVRIAIDGSTKMPLSVQVFARDSTSPAIDVSFSKVTFKTPSSDNFEFSPPPGATVHPGTPARVHTTPATPATPAIGTHDDAQTIGSGWSTIAEYRIPPAQLAKSAGPLLGRLAVVGGAWGHGRLLTSALVSVLITDDGRVFAGSVDPSALYAAAATHK